RAIIVQSRITQPAKPCLLATRHRSEISRRENTMSLNCIKPASIVLCAVFVSFLGTTRTANADDPMPRYMDQVSTTKLANWATDLVTVYGPRYWNAYRPYIGSSCT